MLTNQETAAVGECVVTLNNRWEKKYSGASSPAAAALAKLALIAGMSTGASVRGRGQDQRPVPGGTRECGHQVYRRMRRDDGLVQAVRAFATTLFDTSDGVGEAAIGIEQL